MSTTYTMRFLEQIRRRPVLFLSSLDPVPCRYCTRPLLPGQEVDISADYDNRFNWGGWHLECKPPYNWGFFMPRRFNQDDLFPNGKNTR